MWISMKARPLPSQAAGHVWSSKLGESPDEWERVCCLHCFVKKGIIRLSSGSRGGQFPEWKSNKWHEMKVEFSGMCILFEYLFFPTALCLCRKHLSFRLLTFSKRVFVTQVLTSLSHWLFYLIACLRYIKPKLGEQKHIRQSYRHSHHRCLSNTTNAKDATTSAEQRHACDGDTGLSDLHKISWWKYQRATLYFLFIIL